MILDEANGRIDLRRQDGAITAEVLDSLRSALRLNDIYVHLLLSCNPIDDEALGLLCGIVKDRPALMTLELHRCNLTDRGVRFYLVPALLVHKTLRYLDLSYNPHITDTSIEALCMLLTDTNLLELRLAGTSIATRGARSLVEALEGNASLEFCELPFTAGFTLIDRSARLTQRNRRHKAFVQRGSARRRRRAGRPATGRGAGGSQSDTDADDTATLMATAPRHAIDAAAGNIAAASSPSSSVSTCEPPIAALETRARQEQRALTRYREGRRRGRRRAQLYDLDGACLAADLSSTSDLQELDGTRPEGEATARVIGAGTRVGRRTLVDTYSGPSNALPIIRQDRRHETGGGAGRTTRGEVLGMQALTQSTDPHLQNALVYLCVMHDRCQLHTLHQQEQRRWLRHAQGLDAVASHSAAKTVSSKPSWTKLHAMLPGPTRSRTNR